jgi:sugar phosphate isomerase/epimerase
MQFGLDQFSYHRFYGDVFRTEQDPGVRWRLGDFLDRAQSVGVDLVGLHIHYLRDGEPDRLMDLLAARKLAHVLEWGHPDGLKMGTSPEAADDLLRWIRWNASSGGKLMRFVAGYPTWRGKEPVADQIARLVPVIRRACDEAGASGMTLAIENHGDFTPVELLDLIERVDRANLKMCFDTGNCVRLGADLRESARLVAAQTGMVHLKDLRVIESSRGNPNAPWLSVPLGQGSFSDLSKAITTMIDLGFDGPWLIEMAPMHYDFPDEQDAVEQSVRWLSGLASTLAA